jgi:DNA helicase IV
MGYSELRQREQQPGQTEQELREESRKIRRLQLMMNLVMSTISQTDVSLEEASQMVADAKTAALTMFPDKELAYDLIYKPRLQRLMRERFHLQ